METLDRMILILATLSLITIAIYTIFVDFYFIEESFGRIFSISAIIVFIVFMIKNGKEMDLW